MKVWIGWSVHVKHAALDGGILHNEKVDNVKKKFH